jgi:hypothetical protein
MQCTIVDSSGLLGKGLLQSHLLSYLALLLDHYHH